MVNADLNPKIVVKTLEEGLDLTFYGAALDNTAGIMAAQTEAEFVQAVLDVKSPTGAVRLQLPEEDGTHLVNVEIAPSPIFA